jgi:hypothetical protein
VLAKHLIYHYNYLTYLNPRKTGEAFCNAEQRHVARWKAGQSFHEIGHAFGKGPQSFDTTD